MCVCVVCEHRQVLAAGLSSGLALMYGLTDETRPSIQIKVPLLPRLEDAASLVSDCVCVCARMYVYLCVNVNRAG